VPTFSSQLSRLPLATVIPTFTHLFAHSFHPSTLLSQPAYLLVTMPHPRHLSTRPLLFFGILPTHPPTQCSLPMAYHPPMTFLLTMCAYTTVVPGELSFAHGLDYCCPASHDSILSLTYLYHPHPHPQLLPTNYQLPTSNNLTTHEPPASDEG
jgi:hypothetical protein